MTLKTDKKTKELTLQEVNRSHPALREFRLLPATVGTETAAADAAEAEKQKGMVHRKP